MLEQDVYGVCGLDIIFNNYHDLRIILILFYK